MAGLTIDDLKVTEYTTSREQVFNLGHYNSVRFKKSLTIAVQPGQSLADVERAAEKHITDCLSVAVKPFVKFIEIFKLPEELQPHIAAIIQKFHLGEPELD